ncbi:helix-turn-helix domain-containing protein [Pseudescherichia vulneris]
MPEAYAKIPDPFQICKNSQQLTKEVNRPFDESVVLSMVGQLRQVRKYKKLTQEDIAEMTGLKFQNISRIERGCVIPNLKTLLRYASALGCGFELVFHQTSDSTNASE